MSKNNKTLEGYNRWIHAPGNLKIMVNKKAQHEITGFVLIVVIVSIIGLFFLSFGIGRKESKYNSIEISNLLEASMYHTTDCVMNYIPQYRNGQDLIRACYNEKMGNYLDCLDGRNVCDALESNLKEVIETGLNIDERGVNKAYKLDIYYQSIGESGPREEILFIEKGIFSNCSSVVGGWHPIAVSGFGSGNINVELEVCKS